MSSEYKRLGKVFIVSTSLDSQKELDILRKHLRVKEPQNYYINSFTFSDDSRNAIVEIKAIKVAGKPVKLQIDDIPLDCFIYQDPDKTWVVTEAMTGSMVAESKTQSAALASAKGKLDRYAAATDKFNMFDKLIENINRMGLSPRYEYDQAGHMAELKAARIKVKIPLLLGVRKSRYRGVLNSL
nr:hypothetical protein [uncultured Arsenicibacter sp.]